MPAPKKPKADKPTRVKKQKARKQEAQADLKTITEAHAPPSARDEKGALAAAVQKVIDAASKRLHQLRHPSHEKNTRAKIIAYCKWGVANTAAIHYAQIRPMPLEQAKNHVLPQTTDCSGFATCAYYVAGAPDPNHYNYNGSGYTGTLLNNPRIAAMDAKPGDLVIYGNSPGTHVVIVAEAPGMCYSHGQEAGPLYISLAAEASAHSGQPINYVRAL